MKPIFPQQQTAADPIATKIYQVVLIGSIMNATTVSQSWRFWNGEQTVLLYIVAESQPLSYYILLMHNF